MNKSEMNDAIREYIGSIPAHIEACASACRYDLLHGPAWALVPNAGIESFTVDHYATFPDDLEDGESGTIEEVYTGTVGETLRSYIDGLPTIMYYLHDYGTIETSTPTGEIYRYDDADDDDEPVEDWCDPPGYYELGLRDIVEALFGRTIAREFN